MKKFKDVLRMIYNYLYEVLIWFSFTWTVILAISFSCVLPKEGIIVLGIAIIMTSTHWRN